MNRYLHEQEARARLSLGKSIAQFLGYEVTPNYTVLKWLTLGRGDDNAFVVCYHETEDEGDENYLDIFSFAELDEDEPYGVTTEFDTVEDVLSFARSSYEASDQRYVVESVLQDEYADYLRARRNSLKK